MIFQVFLENRAYKSLKNVSMLFKCSLNCELVDRSFLFLLYFLNEFTAAQCFYRDQFKKIFFAFNITLS